MNVDKARETQLRNIQAKTGRSLEELLAWLETSGLARHGELRAWLMREAGLGYGDANTVVFLHLNRTSGAATGATAAGTPAGGADPADALYGGAKAALRPIHHGLMTAIRRFGSFEEAPKKAYVSLRRRKQFATIGPATKTRVDVGLNMTGVEPTARLVAVPPGGMCQYKVGVSSPAEVDRELLAWIRRAYDAAG